MSGYRLPGGGVIDRGRPLRFTFDGKSYGGFAGDSLASALLANGVKIFGRSFKYHRPRGLVSAGTEESNALVTLREGARTEPNTKATMVELHDGLVAKSQNRWPSRRFDVMAVNQLAGPLFSAGFYYKTFMGPTRKAWMLYERVIRKAAGMGAGTFEADPDRYEKMNAFCDVLVVGGGPAGIMAALAAARGGAKVVLAEEDAAFGGALVGETGIVGGLPARDWVTARIDELAALDNATLLPRTTVYGYFDDNTMAAVERVNDHLPVPPAYCPRQRHWAIHARQVVLATGAIERPVVFHGNDTPGVMLADAVRVYLTRYGVAPGSRVAVFANNDGAYRTVAALKAAGVSIVAAIDARATVAEELRALVRDSGAEHRLGQAVTRARGGAGGLASIEVAAWDPTTEQAVGSPERLTVDCLAVSGGWTPTIHLASQAGGKAVWDRTLTAFLPGEASRDWRAAGACRGSFDTGACLAAGAEAGQAAARAAGFGAAAVTVPEAFAAPLGDAPLPLWEVPRPGGKKGMAFVDQQHDVTAEDVRLAHREGFRSVEHLKRYTTLGMAADQGKTSNVNGLALMAKVRGMAIPEVGTTRFRPPYAPVALGALAGEARGARFRPVRRTAMHDWHEANGAEMQAAGAWMRPRVYRRSRDETVERCYVREARAVRESVGMVDVSTLGKIDVQGPDAAAFLDRVYSNGFLNLPVGKARYGLMLRDDGFVYDDGTAWRLGETRFLMTTTTANAAGVLTHLEFLLSAVWPDLKVAVTSVTEQWAGIAVAGPNARKVLEAALGEIDLSNEACPFMAVRAAMLGGIPVLVARLSFSGELAYEVMMGADFGDTAWRRLLDAGKPWNIVAYGVEALGTLRIEKGHVAGAELDGRTTAGDLGLAGMTSKKKHYIGSSMMERPGLVDENRPQLVGVVSLDREPIKNGSHIVAGETLESPGKSLGHVSSTTYSPALETYIALALVEKGRARIGETLYATFPLKDIHLPVELVSPHFFDPDGSRMHA